ncbi:protein kinase C-binding protein 1 isoform X8 [Chanos chanos]|uniref:Protein kinase C-binding protein 1 isoform X8 n=1 Tax=Chanos chanos TaxID=29144 RepID=A0A6J2UXH4_CHACN|nr:protein kinase C-binding protein 1-like isoform X8 [Chanos chanos]
MHPQSLAEGEIKTESDVVEGMDMSIRPKDPASVTVAAQKRKAPSPPDSSNGHSPSETSPSSIKKKKKPGLVNTNNKDQSELRHGPFYYVKQPALTTDHVDVVPQDGRNDFYCWVCHREGQVLCCELCPRVYHAKCLKLAAEPEGDWFCPECEKITVAECIETQSKAMTMLTIEQLSYLLKFALQKMKQPGTEPFQKPVSLEQHPDYAEYIFHPMDLCTLEKNIKKKMYGCTEAFLADMKWILHNCIIYNGGNHKLTQTAKVIVKICEHEMNEIEVCPECYLSACQKRDNWFCEPCSQPHPLVWAKLKGFPFWPAKALREKDGQVDARFFGQHDRAWVPINNCYLMSKEIPFSVKKTKSIFNSAMQEMEVYVENIRKKYGVFNYAPFRTPYTPNNQFQMLLDPANPSAGTARPDKQEKIKLNFDMTTSPMMHLGKSVLSGGAARKISMTDMPRSPMSTNSSAHTGSDVEQEVSERGNRAPSCPYSTGEESMDYTASPASVKTGPAGSSTGSPKSFPPTPLSLKQERAPPTGSILNLNLDRIKAEMDLKELSETVQQQQQQQQQQGAPVLLTSPRKSVRSLDKTIESCKAQLGIAEISEDVYRGVEHSDSDESDKSDSSDSEYLSDEDQKPKNNGINRNPSQTDREPKKRNRHPSSHTTEPEDDKKTPVSDPKEKQSGPLEKDAQEKPETPQSQQQKQREKFAGQDKDRLTDSDSDRELVIDLGEEQAGRDRKRIKREAASAPPSSTPKDTTSSKPETVQQKDTPRSSSSSVTLVTGSSSSSGGDLSIPTASADVAADIAKYTTKMMDAIKGTMTEIYNDLSKSTTGNTIAEIRRLRIEIEKLQWLHQQELSEMKHNLELTMAEMRQSLEQERERMVMEVKKQMELEKQQAVDETKKKQWCANCRKEAIFYCCWNTSYCDYPCQQAHWPEHMKSCTQSATASQQEPEAEVSSDAAVVKPSDQSPISQTSPSTNGATTTDRDSITAEKTRSVTVS